MYYDPALGQVPLQATPMGVSNAPDISQSVMQSGLGDLEFCRVYIVIVSDGTYEDHLEKLNQILKHFEKKGLEPTKKECFGAQKAHEYLSTG